VKTIALEREPVNIQMRRNYNESRLRESFGYQRGGYGKSTPTQLMPHIAAYCRTPFRLGPKQIDIHVINAIGIAFDSKLQPDCQYFLPLTPEKWIELVARMVLTWRFIFTCARQSRLKRVFLARVGGGFFATLLNQWHPEKNYDKLYNESLPPVQSQFPEIEVRSLPNLDTLCSDEMSPYLADSLLVNAWDPWSMVGNGNAGDNSLDGKFGRASAMAVLCWPVTNPMIRYEAV